MRNRISIVATLLIVAAASAYGQSPQTVVNVSVPFKFMVNQSELPPGEYEFRMAQEGLSSLSLRDSTSTHRLRVITRLARTASKQPVGARLVFDTVGEQKFLSEVWPDGGEEGYLVHSQKGKHGREVVN